MNETKKDCLQTFLDNLHYKVLNCNVKNTDNITSEILDKEFIDEIKYLPLNIKLEFGKTLRDIRCKIADSEGVRQHELYLNYIGPRKLVVTSVALPHSPFQDGEYSSIEEVLNAFKSYLSSLSNYFYELECIDSQCVIMEPVHPTFKDDFRRILIDERTWLHVELTQDGLATNIHLIGQSETWQDKLQVGLLRWDHDKTIVENIKAIFDLTNSSLLDKNYIHQQETSMNNGEIICGICFCKELPDNPGLPQPLCQNSNCGVYFHKSCLYQWLVACEGGRPPAFGVANGDCPTCLQRIECSEKNN